MKLSSLEHEIGFKGVHQVNEHLGSKQISEISREDSSQDPDQLGALNRGLLTIATGVEVGQWFSEPPLASAAASFCFLNSL